MERGCIAQTWTFAGEHRDIVVSRSRRKSSISARDWEVGSGRSRRAANDTFAMSRCGVAMAVLWDWVAAHELGELLCGFGKLYQAMRSGAQKCSVRVP